MDVLKLSTPISCLVAGPTMSGKSRFIYKLLQNQAHIFDKQFVKIYYCYAIDQPLFMDMKKNMPKIVFYQGIPDMTLITSWSKEGSVMLVFDDFQEQISNSKEASDLLLAGTHHLGVSSIIVYQNLYPKNKYARNIALNTQVYLMLKNRRNMDQLSTFGRQILPGKCPAFNAICVDAFDKYGYLMVVTDPRLQHTDLMLRTNIFPEDGPTIVYTCK